MRLRTAVIAGVASIFIAIVVVVVVSVVVNSVLNGGSSAGPVHTYAGGSASFLGDLRGDRVREIEIDANDNTMKVTLTSGSAYSVAFPDMSLLAAQLAQHPDVAVISQNTGSRWPSALWLIVPGFLGVLVVAFAIFLALRRWLRETPEPADDLSARLAELQGRVERLERQPAPPSRDT